jgi:hypothetical protein
MCVLSDGQRVDDDDVAISLMPSVVAAPVIRMERWSCRLWNLAAVFPQRSEHLRPVADDWRSTENCWGYGFGGLQKFGLFYLAVVGISHTWCWHITSDNCAPPASPKTLVQGGSGLTSTYASNSRDRLVVRTPRCGRGNPGSNPGLGRNQLSGFLLNTTCIVAKTLA